MSAAETPDPSVTVPGWPISSDPNEVSGHVSGWLGPTGPGYIEVQALLTEQIRVSMEGGQFTIVFAESVAAEVAEALIAVAGQLSAARTRRMQAESNS